MTIQGRQEAVAAFEAVVAHYEGALLRYACRLADPDTAQDIVQETFLRLHEGWRAAMEPSPVMNAWLYRVVHNSAIDFRRREARRRLLHLRQAEERERHAEPDCGASSRVSDSGHRAAQALRRLKDREQQIVILKVYEGKSYQEISEITGLTTGNVGFILHHAMRRMAEWLQAGAGAGGEGREGRP